MKAKMVYRLSKNSFFFFIKATANVNNHVCLWNPYVVSKPTGVLRGHMAPVIQVSFSRNRGQLVSLSKDKVLRIWDVQLQVCVQRVAGMFPKGPEVGSQLLVHETYDRFFITFNYIITVLEMKKDVKDRVVTHSKPVIAGRLLPLLSQVVTAANDGSITFWQLDSGQKLKELSVGCEITHLTVDQTGSRIYAAGTDGIIRVMDVNGYVHHLLDCNTENASPDIGNILVLKRAILAVGWAKHLTVFRNHSMRQPRVEPEEWKGGQHHSDDILALDFLPSSTLATGSYDGEIVIWNNNSELPSKRLNQRARPVTRSNQRPVDKEEEEDIQGSFAVSELKFLRSRQISQGNLISCGANGWVRFWSTGSATLFAEFQAHPNAANITMVVDEPKNELLVTGDVEGAVKVWRIADYAKDEPLEEPPFLQSQYTAHIDSISSIDIMERSGRTLIVVASTDCSVSVHDVDGRKVGVFGQEQHWKVELPKREITEDDEKLDRSNAQVIFQLSQKAFFFDFRLDYTI